MRILFLFATDWNHELEDYRRGRVPSHRLYGFADVKRLGHDPFLCWAPGSFQRWLRKPIAWRIYQAGFSVFSQLRTDCIFAVNEASALPVLVLKRLGLLRTPTIVLNTGLMHPRNLSGARCKMWKWLLPCAEAVVSLTTMEKNAVWRQFTLREDRQFLINMLVDTEWFRPDSSRPTGDYCLAAGTNQGRDYPTLLKAFPKAEKLVIVTDAYNAAIIEREAPADLDVQVRQAVPIVELKKLYEGAKIVINPMADVEFTSGHTVLLENMALGKPVIVSSVKGMRDYMTDGETAVAVPPHDVEALQRKIHEMLEAPERFSHIGSQAAEWVQRFSSMEFAKKVIQTVEHVVRRNAPSPDAVQLQPISHAGDIEQKEDVKTPQPLAADQR